MDKTLHVYADEIGDIGEKRFYKFVAAVIPASKK